MLVAGLSVIGFGSIVREGRYHVTFWVGIAGEKMEKLLGNLGEKGTGPFGVDLI